MEVLVDRTRASPAARERTKVMLLTLGRALSVGDGCARLGVGRTRFQVLRRRMLEDAAFALEDREVGRPRHARPRTTREERRLAQCVRELEHELLVVRAELDIARSEAAGAVHTRLRARGGWR